MFLIKSFSIILNSQFYGAVDFSQPEVHQVCLGMFADIIQGFLGYSEEIDLQGNRYLVFLDGDFLFDADISHKSFEISGKTRKRWL